MAELCTERQLIATVAERWKREYFQYGQWLKTYACDSAAKYQQLLQLGDGATAADVAAVIGTNSWTGASCNECGEYFSTYMRLGEDVNICRPCLVKALAAWPK